MLYICHFYNFCQFIHWIKSIKTGTLTDFILYFVSFVKKIRSFDIKLFPVCDFKS